ncbi:putative ribonuclease H protein [Glycine soja]
MMMRAYESFSKATGLLVNPQKCSLLCAGIDAVTKREILEVSGFQEGQLPFKYLGVPVTSKKLSTIHYSPLIDKIVGKIKHWTARLLSYAGRLQLVNSVMFALTNYWLNCFPFPKSVLQKIEAICRIFLWTGGFEGSRKSPVAWKQICSPRSCGGLNIIDIDIWNKANLMKLLWNLSSKEDSLWVKWIQAYYVKRSELMHIEMKNTDSWIMKAILKQREDLEKIDNMEELMIRGSINMGKLYRKLQDCGQRKEWKNLLYGNTARPRANFILWLACHGRLSTKDRLCKYGMIDDKSCCFCSEEESMNHLFFVCDNSKRVWMEVLQWVQIRHDPSDWPNELHWLTHHTKGKGTRAAVLKMAIAETIYEIWNIRNNKIFGQAIDINTVSQPTLRREGDARLAGCVFHERNTRGVATNVYLRKTSEKTGKDAIYELLSERFGSCIYARGSKIGEVAAAQLAQASQVASSRSNSLLEEYSGGPKWAWHLLSASSSLHQSSSAAAVSPSRSYSYNSPSKS